MFGLLAGCIAYANFLLYFVRIHLSSAYIDPASNFSMHATSLAFVTLFVCQSLNLLFARAARHKAFFTQHLWSSQRLFAALGLALFIMLNLLYNPPLANMFGAVGLDVGDWSMVILAATVYICARLLQRHTRQHARHAVVKLHHKVYGKNSPARI
jgi:magnesium-transporting ATPase (P-type)